MGLRPHEEFVRGVVFRHESNRFAAGIEDRLSFGIARGLGELHTPAGHAHLQEERLWVVVAYPLVGQPVEEALILRATPRWHTAVHRAAVGGLRERARRHPHRRVAARLSLYGALGDEVV